MLLSNKEALDSFVKAMTILEDVLGMTGNRLGDWNDAPERTLEEILATFAKARELLVAEEAEVYAPSQTKAL